MTVGVALAGCSSQPKSGTGAGADASALVSQSATAMKAVTGMHVVISVEGKLPNVKITKLEADVASTPAVVGTGEATMQMGGSKTQTAKITFVNGHLYSDIAEPGKWVDYGSGTSIYDLGVLFSPDQGLANALSRLHDPKTAGSDTIGGTVATKVTATVSTNDVAELAGLTKAPQNAQDVPITVWIATSDPHYLVQAQVQSTLDTTAKMTMTLSDFGKTVSVTAPPISNPTGPAS
jgi:lipoprotein LprA